MNYQPEKNPSQIKDLESTLIALIESRFSQSQLKIDVLQAENAKLHEKCSELAQTNATLNMKLAEMSQKMETQEKQKVATDLALRELSDEVKAFQCPNLGRFVRKLDSLEKHVTEFDSALKASTATVAPKITTLESELQKVQSESESRFTGVMGEISALKISLQTRTQVRDDSSSTCPNIVRIIRKFTAMSRKLAELETKVAASEAKVEEHKEELTAKVGTLQDDVKKVKLAVVSGLTNGYDKVKTVEASHSQ